MIAYGHGLSSSRNEADPLKSHLASHGYVVIAPDFPLSNGQAPGGPTIADMANQPGDLAFVVAQVNALTGDHSDVGRAMDIARQGVAGLSLGGATTLIAVYHPVLHLDKPKAAVAFAPLSCPFGQAMYVHAVPTLILSGSSDELVPFDTIATRPQAWAPPPLQVGKLVGGTHMGFVGTDFGDAGNSDEFACGIVANMIAGATADPATLQPTIDALNAGTDAGIANLSACGAVCPTKYVQTMSSTRQIELTKAAALAHFEAVLRGKNDNAAYLATSFDADNDDVEVTRAR
jgi:predicted dienelactone hydrolase